MRERGASASECVSEHIAVIKSDTQSQMTCLNNNNNNKNTRNKINK